MIMIFIRIYEIVFVIFIRIYWIVFIFIKIYWIYIYDIYYWDLIISDQKFAICTLCFHILTEIPCYFRLLIVVAI